MGGRPFAEQPGATRLLKGRVSGLGASDEVDESGAIRRMSPVLALLGERNVVLETERVGAEVATKKAAASSGAKVASKSKAKPSVSTTKSSSRGAKPAPAGAKSAAAKPTSARVGAKSGTAKVSATTPSKGKAATQKAAAPRNEAAKSAPTSNKLGAGKPGPAKKAPDASSTTTPKPSAGPAAAPVREVEVSPKASSAPAPAPPAPAPAPAPVHHAANEVAEPVAAPPGAEFKVGDKAVYPRGGVAEVIALEELDIGGNRQRFYVLRLLANNSKIRVPVGNTSAVGLRQLISEQEIQEVFDILRERTIAFDKQTWNRRYRGFMDKIKTGSIYDVAEVLRDLYRLKTDKQLSFGERRMLDEARSLIVKEIAIAREQTEEHVKNEIESIFLTT
jgi:CarD family transcriptional regulator